jgi:hypothetical protein
MYKRNNSHQRGQGLVEYAIIGLLVALIVLFALAALGINLREVYCSIAKIFGVTQCGLGSKIWTPQSWTVVQGNNWNTDGPICGGPAEGRIFADDFSGNDYVINIDTAQLSQGNGYGVYFRSTGVDHVNGYTFQFDPGYGSGAFIFRKWVNGNELSPPFAVASAPGFDWYNQGQQVQLQVVGDTFTALVNNQPVLTATDDTYAEGGIGLRTWDNTKACFNGISVSEP